LNPKDVEAFNNRCWARTVIGDLQAALKDCNEALRLRPNFVDALDSRGLVNLKSGQTKNAIADFDAALKINPRLTSSLYGRGLAKKRIGSLSEGELDIDFKGPVDSVSDDSALLIQADGKIVMVAGFTILRRLHSDGSVDPTFEKAVANGGIEELAVHPQSGKIYCNGSFTQVNGLPRNGVARFNSDGSLDLSFVPPVDLAWKTLGSRPRLAVEPDGKLIIGHNFLTPDLVGGAGGRLVRLNLDGSLDAILPFDPRGGSLGAGIVYRVLVQPDGKILVCGDFTTVNGVRRVGIVRLHGGNAAPALLLGGVRRAGDGRIEHFVLYQCRCGARQRRRWHSGARSRCDVRRWRDGVDRDRPVRLHARATVQRGELTIDLTGCDPQCRGPVNLRRALIESCCFYALIGLIDPNLRYSNAFWAFPDKHVYMAVGSRCQIIMVLPTFDIVAVATAKDSCPFSRLADLIAGVD
jgi:hypothetical protein